MWLLLAASRDVKSKSRNTVVNFCKEPSQYKVAAQKKNLFVNGNSRSVVSGFVFYAQYSYLFI